MNTCTLNLDHVDDLIPQLAKHFNTDYYENFGEFSLKIPERFGQGAIWGINFPNGVGLHFLKGEFYEDFKLYFSNDSISSLRFIYCVKGCLEHVFGDDDEVKDVKRYQHIITAPKYSESESFCFKAHTETLICYLEIDRERFQQQLSYDLTKIDASFYSLFADINNLTRIWHKGYYSLEISDIISQLDTYEQKGLIRTNFLGAKALEIMSAMLALYRQDASGVSKKPILREHDMEAIVKAVAHIEENLNSLGTIPEIAEAVGLEPYRLQQGFKKVYHVTVNDFIKDHRLKLALKMLTTENKNVSEVVYELGLSSRSYFSKIFKEKYGISPKEISMRDN